MSNTLTNEVMSYVNVIGTRVGDRIAGESDASLVVSLDSHITTLGEAEVLKEGVKPDHLFRGIGGSHVFCLNS